MTHATNHKTKDYRCKNLIVEMEDCPKIPLYRCRSVLMRTERCFIISQAVTLSYNTFTGLGAN